MKLNEKYPRDLVKRYQYLEYFINIENFFKKWLKNNYVLVYSSKRIIDLVEYSKTSVEERLEDKNNNLWICEFVNKLNIVNGRIRIIDLKPKSDRYYPKTKLGIFMFEKILNGKVVYEEQFSLIYNRKDIYAMS